MSMDDKTGARVRHCVSGIGAVSEGVEFGAGDLVKICKPFFSSGFGFAIVSFPLPPCPLPFLVPFYSCKEAHANEIDQSPNRRKRSPRRLPPQPRKTTR